MLSCTRHWKRLARHLRHARENVAFELVLGVGRCQWPRQRVAGGTGDRITLFEFGSRRAAQPFGIGQLWAPDGFGRVQRDICGRAIRIDNVDGYRNIQTYPMARILML